jgi:hypothetical protein
MIEDKITLVLKDIAKHREELKEIKKEQRRQEKLDTQEYLEIKRVYTDLKRQKKDAEDAWLKELDQDAEYKSTLEMKVKKEEEIAQLNQKLFEAIATLPQKPFLMNVEMEAGPVKVQIMPEMHLYINGREEKKRAM